MTTNYDIATKKCSQAKFLFGLNHSNHDVDAFGVLCQHVISHSPDSVNGRRAAPDSALARDAMEFAGAFELVTGFRN